MPAGKTVKNNRKSIMPMVQDVVGALMPGAMGAGIARSISKGRLGSSNPVTPSMPRDPDTYPKPSRPASSVPGISSREEPDYPTSAPSFSKRPQARPKPMKPRARPARIEQEAAEAAAVERGNNEARRRASDTQNFSGGGSVERPNRNKKVDTSIIEQGGVTPIRALTAALMNRRDRKEDRKYQESLKDMGMFEDGGGRANVSSSKDPKYRDMRKKFRDGGSVRGVKSVQTSGTGFSGTF